MIITKVELYRSGEEDVSYVDIRLKSTTAWQWLRDVAPSSKHPRILISDSIPIAYLIIFRVLALPKGYVEGAVGGSQEAKYRKSTQSEACCSASSCVIQFDILLSQTLPHIFPSSSDLMMTKDIHRRVMATLHSRSVAQRRGYSRSEVSIELLSRHYLIIIFPTF